MTNPNEPITPIDPRGCINQGLTKREYFAAMAMQGMYSNHLFVDRFNCGNAISEEAVKIADELITALNNTDNGK